MEVNPKKVELENAQNVITLGNQNKRDIFVVQDVRDILGDIKDEVKIFKYYFIILFFISSYN